MDVNTDRAVRSHIQAHYPGGWEAFQRDLIAGEGGAKEMLLDLCKMAARWDQKHQDSVSEAHEILDAGIWAGLYQKKVPTAEVESPDWVRVGAGTAVARWREGHVRTCEHNPSPLNPQPVFTAAWEPGLVTCKDCVELFARRGSEEDRRCDGCGKVVPVGDYIYPSAVQFGDLTWQFGVCFDCGAFMRSTRKSPPGTFAKPGYQVMICQVCNRVLNAWRNPHTGEVLYQHTWQDQEAGADEDHQPVPIPAPDGYSGGRCDFCNLDGPTHDVPAEDFPIPDELQDGVGFAHSRGHWGACDRCAELVGQDKWFALIVRCIVIAQIRHGRSLPSMRKHLGTLYDELRKHITGPPYLCKVIEGEVRKL